jgi:hypothetical protein
MFHECPERCSKMRARTKAEPSLGPSLMKRLRPDSIRRCVEDGYASVAATRRYSSLGEGMAQHGTEVGDLPLRDPGGQYRLRSVKRPAPLMEFDRYASLHQPLRVEDGFVAVRIELRGRDVGGR